MGFRKNKDKVKNNAKIIDLPKNLKWAGGRHQFSFVVLLEIFKLIVDKNNCN